MSEPKFTPGPWRWQGEDYRFGWGWQMLVGPSGEGLIVGQDVGGGPCRELMVMMPIDPALCVTGLAAKGKPHVEPVHVFSEANARLIQKAPDLYSTLESLLPRMYNSFEPDNQSDDYKRVVAVLAEARGEA